MTQALKTSGQWTYWVSFLALSFVFWGLGVWGQGHINLQTNVEDLLSVKLTRHMVGIFVLAALLGVFAFVPRLRWLLQPALILAWVASALALAMWPLAAWESFQVLGAEGGHWGISNLYEVSVLLVALVGGMGIEACRRHPQLGLFLLPLLLIGAAFVFWLDTIGQAGPRYLVPALKSYWLPFHVLANFVGYAAFAVAAAAGAMQLARWQADRKKRKTILPSQKACEDVAAKAIGVGFPVFTLAIILGSAWAYEAWGGWWSWDPKETWALIVWLCYAGYLHARLTHGWRGVKLAIWALVGFVLTLFCYLGVNMFLSGLHSYGGLM